MPTSWGSREVSPNSHRAVWAKLQVIRGQYYVMVGGSVGGRPRVAMGEGLATGPLVPGPSGVWLLRLQRQALSFRTSFPLPLPAALLSAHSLLRGMGGSPLSLLFSNGSPGCNWAHGPLGCECGALPSVR